MRFAVLDLGSTSFQLLVTEASIDGSLTHILRDRVILNLGSTLAAEGHIPEAESSRAGRVVRRFRDIAERAGARTILPIATSALRDAANRPELAMLLEEAAGAPIRFIDGIEEGRLVFEGIRASVALGVGPTLAFDLGGGSLEVVVGDGSGMRWAESFPLGAARLTTAIARHDPMTRTERREVKALVGELLLPVAETVQRLGPVRCVAAGGTAGALARLLAAKRWSPVPASLNQATIELGELRALSRALCDASLEQRLAMPAMDARRADLLHVGAVVLLAAASTLGATEIVHSEWGLREGVVIDELDLDLPSTPDEIRTASISRLCCLWGLDEAHARGVRDVALLLFDETQPLHHLGARERELLADAAILHDIGVRVSPDHHHKHGSYLIEHAGLRGFSPDEIAIVSSLVRFHRGSGPKTSFPSYAALQGDDRQAAAVLIGLLRIAHGLRRGGDFDVEAIEVTARKGKLGIGVRGSSNPQAAAEEAQERADVLSRALGVDVDVAVSDSAVAGKSPTASA
ncbi:MAG TPA: Ppx/GppA phosphatase family protein [Actinomycetota bacterium]|jgi:exopolyphosphatase/guanosine-5'-triphosphate,3'-diphosphate pyrophosphatase|nr:Ppx/GppA phosphatase family protein [Actinomycetota bacterium]